MPYRDDRPALEARRDDLRREVAEISSKAEALRAAVGAQEAVERELAEVDGKLARLDARRATLLEDVRIASPCSARWADMRGDERVRFCGQCEKKVYDLSMLTRVEAEALIVAQEGSLCLRLFRRVDGTVLTADCPVGVRRKRVRLTLIGVASAGALAGAAVVGLRPYTCIMEAMGGGVVMGKMEAEPSDSYVDQPLEAASPGVVLVYEREAQSPERLAERWQLLSDGSVVHFRGDARGRVLAPTPETLDVVSTLQILYGELQSAGVGAVNAYADGAVYQRYSFYGTGARRATDAQRSTIFLLAQRIAH